MHLHLSLGVDLQKKEHGNQGADGALLFDNVFSMYGRLREICRLFGSGPNARYKCSRFFSVGGTPVYAAFSDPGTDAGQPNARTGPKGVITGALLPVHEETADSRKP